MYNKISHTLLSFTFNNKKEVYLPNVKLIFYERLKFDFFDTIFSFCCN